MGIEKNTLKDSAALIEAFSVAKKKDKIHFLGLVSDGGVHSHMDHLFHLLKLAKEAGIKNAYIHFFADGRDTLPKSAKGYLQRLMDYISCIEYGKIASITGRYYAMDRDKRWERTKVAFDGICLGQGERSNDLLQVSIYYSFHRP